MVEAKTTWGAGEYALMAQALEPASVSVIDTLGVSAGDRVIDIATGTGNAALVAAARGAEVVGIDLEPSLLAIARERAASAGLEIDWLEGDAEALPVADGRADAVVSVFGSMYAPDHAAAARELVRVLAPSGRLGLAAWTPGSLMPAMGAVVAPYLPPLPPASGPPSRWGDPEAVRALLIDAGARLERTKAEQLTLAFVDVQAAADFLIRTAGHIVRHQRELVAQSRWLALREDLVAFVSERAEHRAARLLLHLEYLVSVAARA